MFVYETKVTDNSVQYDALAIVFEKTQIPVATPDVVVWKGANKIKMNVGGTTIEGNIPE